MRRTIYIILAFCLTSFYVYGQSQGQGQSRPKVAVVLAGGGAKGTAHLGALKVIEECGIPIDMIVGTSMGAIVGGLYSVGYTTDEIMKITRETDWINLILDTPDYGNQLLTSKKDQENYLLRIALNRARMLSGTSRGGIIHGNNITAVFNQLTKGLPRDCKFSDFPVEFACVATDAISGKKHVFTEGNLVTAMRSSMALPTIFTPVKVDDMALVDGGIVDNYPADVARALGADIIIGIDLVSDISDEELANSAMDVLSRLLDMISKEQYEKNKLDTDLYISVNTTGYSSASFTSSSIDSLIIRGEKAARSNLTELKSLAKRLNVEPKNTPSSHDRIASVMYRTSVVDFDVDFDEDENELSAQHLKTAFQSGTLSLGARYDNQNYASLQVGIDANLLRRKNLDLSIYGRLGARMMGNIAASHTFAFGGKVTGGYMLEYRDMTYYFKGERLLSFGDYHHQFDINYKQEWRQISYSFGMQYDEDHYRNMLAHSDLNGMINAIPSDRYYTYYAKAEYNSLNAMYFPSNGTQVELMSNALTTNLVQFKDKAPLIFASGYWRTSIPFNTRFNLIPHAAGRITLVNKDVVPTLQSNFIGGLHHGMWVEQQIKIAGIRHMEICQYRNILMGGLDIQQRMGKNHFLVATFDAASNYTNIDESFISGTTFWGFNLGYHYRGFAGPISIIGMWSDRTNEFGITFNVGYYF